MKIGIVGGAGPYASALLYRAIVAECYRAGRQPPEMVVLNYPFTRALSLDESARHVDVVRGELEQCVDALIQQGVERAVLACNTLHLFLAQVNRGIPFLHLPQTVLQEAAALGCRRLLVLATRTTLAHSLYAGDGVELVVPTCEEQQIVDEVVDRIIEGRVEAQDAVLLGELIATIGKRESFDGVILGCTDLPVLHDRYPIGCKKPILDSIQLAAKALTGELT